MNESIKPNTDHSELAVEPVTAQLSAFVDDALPQVEMDLFARRLQRDEGQLKGTMGRYMLIGEALRQGDQAKPGPGVSRDFSARIAAALEQDQQLAPTAVSLGKRSARSWWRPVGVAAASVTVAVLSGMLYYAGQSTDSARVAAGTPAITNKAEAESAAIAAQHAARLANYVRAHSEYSSPLGRANLMTGRLADDSHVIASTAAVDGLPAVVGQ